MLRPLPLLALAQALGIWLADRGVLNADAALVLGAGALGLGIGVARRAVWRRILAAVAALAAGALALDGVLDRAARGRPGRPLEATLEATVRSATRGDSWIRVELAEVAAVEPGVGVLPEGVEVRGPPALFGVPALEASPPGQRIRARLRLRAPHALRNPGARSRLRR